MTLEMTSKEACYSYAIPWDHDGSMHLFFNRFTAFFPYCLCSGSPLKAASASCPLCLQWFFLQEQNFLSFHSHACPQLWGDFYQTVSSLLDSIAWLWCTEDVEAILDSWTLSVMKAIPEIDFTWRHIHVVIGSLWWSYRPAATALDWSLQWCNISLQCSAKISLNGNIHFKVLTTELREMWIFQAVPCTRCLCWNRRIILGKQRGVRLWFFV